MKRVITYGTFDLLHYGHIHLLRRAKELGDYLIVALSTDEFNRNEKGYDISILKYYAGDDIVYDQEYDEEMTQPEQLLGIGWFALFGRGHDTIYIENDTMETIYAVHYLEGSIGDT